MSDARSLVRPLITERLFASLDAMEVELVERSMRSCERMRLQRVAQATTRLGNGWLYPIVSIAIVLARLEAPLRFLFASAVSLLLAFAVYPIVKRSLARTRPCDLDPSLAREIEPLDHYSCPSGHAMTAAAYGVPLIFAWPAAAPLAIGICVVVGWSRVATGHHYVSDVVLGWILGGAIATGVASYAF